MVTLGPFDVHSVQTGTFRLDGGAMFGVVPKVLWEKTTDVDASNRILLATRTLIAVDRQHSRVVLVDTGCGAKWAPKEAERYAIQHDDQAVDHALHSMGLDRGRVTDVVVTHLHFDHNGGLTDWVDEPGGETRPRYARARHWIHRRHWEHAHHPTPKDRASFFPEDYECLAGANLLEFVDGDQPPPPFEGLEWRLTHGHTSYHLHPVFGNDAQRLIFIGDLVPTIAHLRLAWVMAYDLRPVTTIAEKQAVYERAIAERWIVAFAHDPEHAAVQIDGAPERPVVARAIPL